LSCSVTDQVCPDFVSLSSSERCVRGAADPARCFVGENGSVGLRCARSTWWFAFRVLPRSPKAAMPAAVQRGLRLQTFAPSLSCRAVGDKWAAQGRAALIPYGILPGLRASAGLLPGGRDAHPP
jgi:hypothetical protein